MRQLTITSFAILICCWMGCTGSKPSISVQQSETPQRERPPMRILLVEAPELEHEIVFRWKSFSEQPVIIEKMTRSEFTSKAPTSFDIAIYPGMFVGTLVSGDCISSVSTSLLRQLEMSRESTSSSNAEESLKQTTSTLISEWPTRWRQQASFGGAIYGVPLGAPNFVAIARAIDGTALSQLQAIIAGNQNTSEANERQWNLFLTSAEKAMEANREERSQRLSTILERGLSNEQRLALVDRFLWILSTTESRHRGLFDLFHAKARLNQPEFERASKVLVRLASLAPEQMIDSPEAAWESVADGQGFFAIGWPRSDGKERDGSLGRGSSVQVLPIVWNGGNGLMVSIGKRTRQSSVAASFVVWLTSSEQRKALQGITPKVELLSTEDDKNFAREDFREYQSIQIREASSSVSSLTPRFAHSDSYLETLSATLEQILKTPNDSSRLLKECKLKWDGLTEEFSVDLQKLSFERASGHAN